MLEIKQRNKNILQQQNQDQSKSIDDILILKKGNENKISRLKRVFEELDLDNIQQIWAGMLCIKKKVHGSYQKAKLNSYLAFIEEWKVTKLYLWSNKQPNILKNIEDINFYNLRQLHVGWNKIESIEGLSSIRMPKLKQLILCDNYISSITSLNKCELLSLQVLSLRGNRIREITLYNWNFPKLKQLNCNDNSYVSLNPIFKISSQHLSILRIKRTTRFSQNDPILVAKLQSKFSEAKKLDI